MRFLLGLCLLLVVSLAEAQTPDAARLHDAITKAGVVVDSVSIGTIGDSSSVRVSPSSQQAAAQPTINAFDWSTPAKTSYENLKSRDTGIQFYQATLRGESTLWRAEALVLIDEINLIRQWFVAFKAAVAAATTLADLKTRVSALPDMPDRTAAQATNAIKAKINSGAVDSAP